VGDIYILQYIAVIFYVHRIILPVSIKHAKIYKLVKLLLSLYAAAVPFALYKCSIHCRSCPSMTSRVTVAWGGCLLYIYRYNKCTL